MTKKAFLVVLLTAAVTGCAFVKAVSFSEDTARSGKLEDQQVVVIPILQKGVVPQRDTSPVVAKIPEVVRKKCMPEAEKLVARGLPVPVVLGLLSVFFDESSSAVQGYMEGKKETFEKSYGGRVNLQAVTFAQAKNTDILCVGVSRSFKETPGSEEYTSASLMFFKFERVAEDSEHYFIRPIYHRVRYAAAVTEKGKGVKIDVGISMKASVLTEEGRKIEPVFEEIFEFKDVKLSDDSVAEEFGPEYDSNMFVWPSSLPTPAILTISVKETGSGSEWFSKSAESFDARRKHLSDAIVEIVKGKLEDE